MKFKKFLAMLLSIIMVFGTLPAAVFAEETQVVKTQYVKVNGTDEIVPGARYIIVGTYTDPTTGEVSYHAMGKDNRYNGGFRYSYAQDQDGAHHFDISEDKNTITLYSYATYDPVLRVRITPRDDEGRFYLGVDGKGYLCGFSSRTSDGTVGHDAHSCMPISNSTVGETWWYMRVAEGDYAGDWQIVNRSRLGNYRGYSYDVMQMGRPYPNSAGQFRAEVAYLRDMGEIDENERIKYTVDQDTNILLYREICAHSPQEVTHASGITATCNQPGLVEYWYCAGCRQYFSDEAMTQTTTLENAMTAPPAHKYDQSGVCSVCGESKTGKTFLEYESSGGYSESMNGAVFIAVGFNDGKAYVMGNDTNPDGTRAAVEVGVQENGTIKTDTAVAEFLSFDFDEITFCPDNGYMTVMGGMITVYDKSLVGAEGLPEPIRFNSDSYLDNSGYFFRFPADGGYRYIVFDEESLSFKPSKTAEDSIFLYKEACAHPEDGWHYTPATEATCTEQGSAEYWYCDYCYNFFQNGDFDAPADLGEYHFEIYSKLTLKATGHDFNDEGVCERCSMKRPVYTQVSTLEQFDGLSEDAQYIIVIKDGEKTYAAYLPVTQNPCDTDSDGDGMVDALDVDENSNTIPDAFEELFEFEGIGDMDEDGDVDIDDYGVWVGDRDENGELDLEDYRIFLEEWYWNFVYMYDSRAAELSNFVEVTMAADGSITLSDEGAMEFQMVSAGIHGGQEYFEEDFEYYEIKDTERIRAAWVPNAWIGYDGMLGSYSEGHFVTQERTSGDGDFPGITDMKNWKISFREDGSACLVDSWTDYDDTAALQFVKYVNENDEADMTIVGLSEYEWEYSAIMSARTELLPVYLYASEAVFVTPPHDCVWGRWTEDENDSHTRRCTVEGCRKTETEPHEWDGGKVTEAPTCTENGTTTYICFTCGATKTESIDELGHDWGDWTYDGADYHVRICERTDCTEKDYGSHKWSDWSSTGSREHKAVCSECNHEHTDTHSWDDGVEIKPATVTDEGTKKYLCTDCGATKTEVIPKIVCDHSFGKWTADDNETHTRVCINGTGCKAYERQPHRWNEGTVTVGATETAEGLMTYICLGCGYERTEKIPMLQHTHRFGDWVSNGDGTHSCYCENGVCTAVETAEHSCELWEDNEDGATHSGACVYCEEKLTETHDWSDWAVGVTEDQLVRNCHCGAFEEMDIHQTIWDAVTNLTPVDNGAGAELVIENTLDLFNDVLTDAEQNAVAGGDATVSIYLDVTDVPVNEVSASDKAAAAAAIEDENNGLDEESEIGMYLDINLFKEVTTNEEGTTETDTSKISETPGKVTITIKIPQELINADRSVERIYRIIRIHQSADGSILTDVIEGKHDPENQTFTFETDKFSTYAVVYSDVEPSAVPGDLNDDGKINAKDAVLLAQYLAEWDVEINLVAADCKKDGVINAKDAVLLAQYLANWSVTLG